MKNVSFFRRDFLQEVSAGNRLSLFLTNKGELYQSGRLYMKQGGRTMWHPTKITEYLSELPPVIEQSSHIAQQKPITEDQTSVEQLEAIVDPPPRIIAVEAGHMACYALSDQGEVYSWGSALFGQLGLEGIDESLRAYAAATSPKKTKPTPPTSNQDEGKDSEEEEDEYNDEEDDEEAGKGEKLRAEQAKELRGKRVLVLKKPILLKTLTQWKITKVRAGNHYVLAVSSTGKVFSWGRNTNGQLGIGHTQDTSVPTPIESLQQHFCVEISTGFAHVVGIFASVPQFNKVFSWGRGRNGCLGLGGTKDEMLPREVTFFCGLNATKVAAGSDHSLVLCSCGSQTCVYAFGGNTFGQLGINSTSDHFEMPHFLDELGDNIASIGAGARYSAALTVLGELFTWGDGMYGKTNQPTSRTTIVPWRVDTFADHFVTQVSIGQHHGLGVMRDSCKGINRWRQFPLNDIIVPFLHMDERKVEDYYSMTCESSHIQLSHTFFSIHLTCETCEMKDPICRVCIRRCHQGHVLKPTVRGASKTSCVCGRKQDRKKCLAVIPEPIPEEE